ncbi:sulfite reductase (NADPH) hemoprotein beta-component [Pseudomonas sp. SLBN-26]|uniref:nitrite/sulfite reductase n=1 Tax=Pseudomonadaceae TaxID=135621 RepID=UPI0011522384|nr:MULTISPECIES: nitrite/sulfite reductase [Pseudomonas]MCP1618454.1 sulfite reductase (NADPH) hemoprotein beta-component [Pseudomonas otitidis]TQL07689.1 sulfite reductase (NADPH) hemoprotein beta-component [Pseudomonas sp. SLBN-26]
MYRYDDYDRALVRERVAQFRDQVARRLSGELSEEEFLPLRLQNGLYLQKHAYMLRVAIPYGTLSSDQLRTLALIAREYDRGYGHFTTRQNIQFNWIDLERVPDILERLADVDMHAIQTSGNCVRNITTEAFAGVAADELLDPRPLAEILRQWSTVNPEFLFLPRKFKIALCAAEEDRAAVQMHDIGLYLYRDGDGEMRLKVLVGGGLGRTPILAQVIREGLHWRHLLSYVEAVLRVYNRHGRRDNKYKARIKILVKALGIEAFAREVEAEWEHLRDGPAQLTEAEYTRVAASFTTPAYATLDAADLEHGRRLAEDPAFARWCARNLQPHKVPGYASVVISTKPGPEAPPGDVTDAQMEAVAEWAERFGFGEIRIAHEQNLVLPDVPKRDLHALWLAACEAGLATPNVGLLTDIIACPGGDYCALANAKSIPIAQAIQARFRDPARLEALGELSLNISGCMNACGHHHIGNIGILGVDKGGSEWYQVTLGGAQGMSAALGRVIGPSFSAAEVPQVIEHIADTYLAHREGDERFVDTLGRIGLEPFKARVYTREEEPA